ncbi:MAG: hypothetical protein GY909_07495 [Oligoflexia bacterium]|nr:hypothetical protein [Oligoflexia bacterium]
MKKLLVILTTLTLVLIPAWSDDTVPTTSKRPEPRPVVTPESKPTPQNDETTAFTELGLEEEDLKRVAKSIFNVSKAMSEEYSISDGLTLTMYILRYLSEIGEYELAHVDMMKLVRAFEKLSEEKIEPEVEDTLQQIAKISFGRKQGKFAVTFYAKDKKRGIVIPINEKEEDPNSSVEEIVEVVAEDGTEVVFEDIDTEEEKAWARNFAKRPVKILGIFKKLAEDLYQVHPKIKDNIDDYLELEKIPAPALKIEMENIYVSVDTSTIFKNIKFRFQEALTLPGIREEGKPVPSFILGAKAKLLNLKVSVDQ